MLARQIQQLLDEVERALPGRLPPSARSIPLLALPDVLRRLIGDQVGVGADVATLPLSTFCDLMRRRVQSIARVVEEQPDPELA